MENLPPLITSCTSGVSKSRTALYKIPGNFTSIYNTFNLHYNDNIAPSKQLMKTGIITPRQSPATKVNDAKSICQWGSARLKNVIKNFCAHEFQLKREKTFYITIVISLTDVPEYMENLLFLNSQSLSWQPL